MTVSSPAFLGALANSFFQQLLTAGQGSAHFSLVTGDCQMVADRSVRLALKLLYFLNDDSIRVKKQLEDSRCVH